MEPRAHHILIGLFTTLVAAAAIIAALWLGRSSHGERDTRDYVVVFNEAVRGLSQRSAVQYSGIRIGEVTRLTLDPSSPNRVRARIRIDASVPVRQDTQARLVLVNIAGTSVIELSGGSHGSPALAGENGEPPLIIARPSPLARLMDDGGGLLANVSELAASARQVLSAENAQKLSSILSSLEQLAGAMERQGGQLDLMVQTLVAAAAEATETLKQASRLMAGADDLVRRQGRAALEGAQKAALAIERTAASVDRMLAQNQGALGKGMQGLGQLGPALQELRATLASIRAVSGNLQDDPAGYLLGRERIQEFTP